MTPEATEQYLKWLDENIVHCDVNLAKFPIRSKDFKIISEHRSVFALAKEKFLSLTQPVSDDKAGDTR